MWWTVKMTEVNGCGFTKFIGVATAYVPERWGAYEGLLLA